MKYNGKLISFCENLGLLYHVPRNWDQARTTKSGNNLPTHWHFLYFMAVPQEQMSANSTDANGKLDLGSSLTN